MNIRGVVLGSMDSSMDIHACIDLILIQSTDTVSMLKAVGAGYSQGYPWWHGFEEIGPWPKGKKVPTFSMAEHMKVVYILLSYAENDGINA